jgi:hypothetical protein
VVVEYSGGELCDDHALNFVCPASRLFTIPDGGLTDTADATGGKPFPPRAEEPAHPGAQEDVARWLLQEPARARIVGPRCTGSFQKHVHAAHQGRSR